MYALTSKWKQLKKCLQEWNKTTFSSNFDKVAQAEELRHQKEILHEQVNMEEAYMEWSHA